MQRDPCHGLLVKCFDAVIVLFSKTLKPVEDNIFKKPNRRHRAIWHLAASLDLDPPSGMVKVDGDLAEDAIKRYVEGEGYDAVEFNTRQILAFNQIRAFNYDVVSGAGITLGEVT